ncbi:MAG: hypothetical protein MI749_13595 [Desulfovibrionales bacterium]|nr:hypothetical protein [Desulfovibrionales bacterium]
MSKPDHPAITTLQHIKALFCGRTLQDASRTWRAAPHISESFIDALKAEWAHIRNTKIDKNFQSRNAKREALNMSFTVEGIEVYPKLYTRNDCKNALLHTVFFPEARRNFCTMCYLQEHGLLTTEPLALLSGNRLHPQHETVLFTRKLDDNAIHFYAFRKILAGMEQPKRAAFFMEFGKKMAQLHNLGIYTEDTDKNISVILTEGTYDLYFYDFDNFYPWRVPNAKRMMHAVLHSLFCPHYTATLEEARIFVQTYTTVRQYPELKAVFMAAIEAKLAAI